MLTDEQWAELDPLIEACRPKGKTPSLDLRRTISAILWRHQNGSAWRAVPAELGPWWQAGQVFIRWARAGVWGASSISCRTAASPSAWCFSTPPTSAPTRKRRARPQGGIWSRARRS